jgi:hypothetical protein
VIVEELLMTPAIHQETTGDGVVADVGLSHIGSRRRFPDEAVEMPEQRWIVPRVVAEIEVGGPVNTAVRELQPDRFVDPDAIATHRAP